MFLKLIFGKSDNDASIDIEETLYLLPSLITNKTEKQISKIIDALKTKRKVPNGRINNETILLRTF